MYSKATMFMVVLSAVILVGCQTTKPTQSSSQSSNVEQIVSAKLDKAKATLIDLESKGVKSSAPMKYAKLTKLVAEAETLIQINAYDELEPLLTEFNQITETVSSTIEVPSSDKKVLKTSSEIAKKSSPSSSQKTYTFKAGDTLYSLAIRFYKDPNKWKDILKANSAKISSPSEIFVGQVITLP